MKKTLIFFIPFFIGLTFCPVSHSFWGVSKKIGERAVKTVAKIGKIKGALPEKKIIELTEMIKNTGDIKKVGKVLGNMKLSDDILEDTYMRIILRQKKISKKEAEELFQNLHGVKGFRAALRKTAGISNSKTIGHLNEIQIANSAAKNGFEVVSIGAFFKDGKKIFTDIDVLIKKNGKFFPIEAKNYAPETMIPINKFRADMNTLVSFRKQLVENTVPIFSMTTPPSNPLTRKLLEEEAKKRGIQLIFGTPEEQIHLINQLSKIL